MSQNISFFMLTSLLREELKTHRHREYSELGLIA